MDERVSNWNLRDSSEYNTQNDDLYRKIHSDDFKKLYYTDDRFKEIIPDTKFFRLNQDNMSRAKNYACSENPGFSNPLCRDGDSQHFEYDLDEIKKTIDDYNRRMVYFGGEQNKNQDMIRNDISKLLHNKSDYRLEHPEFEKPQSEQYYNEYMNDWRLMREKYPGEHERALRNNKYAYYMAKLLFTLAGLDKVPVGKIAKVKGVDKLLSKLR